MKKLIILAFLFGAFGLFAQNFNKSKFRSPVNARDIVVEKQSPLTTGVLPSTRMHRTLAGFKSTDIVNPIAIGQAGNAFGFAFMRTTFLWAVNDINSISFIHRMLNPPGTGYLAYDVSMDGGQTWSLDNQVYDPNLPEAYNGRYPQGLLYNPAGNTDPENAYFSYFAPTLDGSNAAGVDWGGYCWGTKKLATGSLPTQHNQTSENGFYQYLPSGFTLTQLGEAWVVDEENDGSSGDYEYTGNLIVGHGTWNGQDEDFDYTFDHLELEVNPEDAINDVKVAFAPDGMTGWICAMSDRIPALPYTSYHPILFKTEDGGQTWSDDPIEVQLGGEDGLEAVRDFISDEELVNFFDPEPVPPRDEIMYFMGFHIDMAVDAWGNPHITGVVAIASQDGSGWYHYEGIMAMFHIYTADQGETWQAYNLDYLTTFDAEYTGSSGSSISQYNRPQVATTEDGAIVFFSFLDTRIEGITDNNQPDIFFQDYSPEMTMHGEEVINVTEWSNAMWQARWGCMSHYVFAEVTDDGNYECTVPFVYEELTDEDISLPVQFWYIPDFQKSYIITSINDKESGPLVSLAQNFPNPFRDVTNFNINLLEASGVDVSVFNTAGQLVKKFDFGRLQNGPHQLTLNFDNLNEGVYFYTFNAGSSSYNGKMIVQ
ncbi:MAG: hypothetical protein B6D64_03080 [Bacteroidetes bacterium 4484_276]|nr:MAG: hypothetical protein B6D64_03080 [Bacteroidetes bacterium 4484_276]OYT13365.1 MAG: hypothetical protein B6I19_05545 [Bacteroidetes bacterium 4572_114]